MSQSAREGGTDAPREPHAAEPLPDLLELDLEALRTMDHPVLASVVADLRGRAGTPQEMLWGFTSAL